MTSKCYPSVRPSTARPRSSLHPALDTGKELGACPPNRMLATGSAALGPNSRPLRRGGNNNFGATASPHTTQGSCLSTTAKPLLNSRDSRQPDRPQHSLTLSLSCARKWGGSSNLWRGVVSPIPRALEFTRHCNFCCTPARTPVNQPSPYSRRLSVP